MSELRTNDARNIIISLEESRLYIKSSTESAISTKIDITPVWEFFKQVDKLKKSKDIIHIAKDVKLDKNVKYVVITEEEYNSLLNNPINK